MGTGKAALAIKLSFLLLLAIDYGLVRAWEGRCIYYSGRIRSELLVLLLDDLCKPGRWIFRLNILVSNLIRLPRGGIRLAYPISSFFKHDALLLNPEAVSVGTPKTVLASSMLNRTTMLQGVNCSNCCLIKLENIYMRSFRLNYFGGLEILAGQQDATKAIATPQVIADSTEISVADHQEIEESKEKIEDMTMNTATEDLFLGEFFFCFIFEI